jgi:hypothetical protein
MTANEQKSSFTSIIDQYYTFSIIINAQDLMRFSGKSCSR